MDYIELVTQGKKGRVIIKILIYYFLGDVTIIPLRMMHLSFR